MRALLVWVLMLSSCSFPRPEASTDGPPGDGSSSNCTPGFVNLCSIAAGTLPLIIIVPTKLNTDTDPRCRVVTQTGGPDICVLAFSRLEITSGATLTFFGSRAVAVMATTEIVVAGTLDVASHRLTQQAEPGAGSLASCAFDRAVEDDNGGGSGGAGGTCAAQGGAGGDGDTDHSLPDDGIALGGMPGMVAALSVLRGGCSGQSGGYNSPARGRGGHGGGAVYLAAPFIQIAGAVLAGGAAGGGGSADSHGGGGGGGGSGGTIILQGDKITIDTDGLLLATGGGGGQGGTNTSVGEDGANAIAITAAPGGDSMPNGGVGGAGSTSGVGTAGFGDNAGGGGGGGGTGYIRILSPMAITTDASIMPAAVISAR